MSRPKLRAVPDTPPRAIGAVRVSTERDEMISPELQRAAIEDHCTRRGFRLVHWIEGLDESGSSRRSPWWARLDTAVEMVEHGDADVIVVWRFSRAARQRLRWAVAIDRVEVAGGLLESATEPLDTSTASGRLARGMLAEMAAYEAEVIGNTWREVHARRTKRGIPAHGKPRFGYRVADGIHRPHEPEASVLAVLYRRYVAGESIRSLVGWLNAEGIQTVPGYSSRGPGAWTTSALRRVLDAGFGAGLILVHGGHERGVHEPVIDEATWQTYLAARIARRPLRRAEASRYLLSGMVRCVYPLPDGTPCGRSMAGGTLGTPPRPGFRCVGVGQQPGRHRSGNVTMRLVEAAVLDWLRELADDVDDAADLVVAADARRVRRRHDVARLQRELVAVEKSISRLVVNQASDPDTPAAIYDEARAELLVQRNRLTEQVTAARAQLAEGEPSRAASDLLAMWDTLPVEHRRGALRKLIARIEVIGRRPRAEIRVVPAFDP